jgi:hypothetical protein
MLTLDGEEPAMTRQRESNQGDGSNGWCANGRRGFLLKAACELGMMRVGQLSLLLFDVTRPDRLRRCRR